MNNSFDKSIYYNPNTILGYNAYLNFIIGMRGVGKTYSLVKYAMNRFLKYDEEFIYLRRYKSELDGDLTKKFLLPHILNNEFDEELKIICNSHNILVNGVVAGYFLPLSTSMILKSKSYPKVQTIIFDEFIIDKGTHHYLPNECTTFLDFVETIARTRDIKVFLLSNAISTNNPYFLELNLSLPKKSEFRTFKNGLIVLQCVKNDEYSDLKKKTRFGQIIDGTKYGEYAIDNKFLRDNNFDIEIKKGHCRPFFTMVYNDMYFGCWFCEDNKCLYFSYDYEKNYPIKICFRYDDHKDKTILDKSRSSGFVQGLIYAIENNKIRFECMNIKNAILPMLRKILHY